MKHDVKGTIEHERATTVEDLTLAQLENIIRRIEGSNCTLGDDEYDRSDLIETVKNAYLAEDTTMAELCSIVGVPEKTSERYTYQATIHTGDDGYSCGDDVSDMEDIEGGMDDDLRDDLEALALEDASHRLQYATGFDAIEDHETLDEYLMKMAEVWHPEELKKMEVLEKPVQSALADRVLEALKGLYNACGEDIFMDVAGDDLEDPSWQAKLDQKDEAMREAYEVLELACTQRDPKPLTEAEQALKAITKAKGVNQ